MVSLSEQSLHESLSIYLIFLRSTGFLNPEWICFSRVDWILPESLDFVIVSHPEMMSSREYLNPSCSHLLWLLKSLSPSGIIKDK